VPFRPLAKDAGHIHVCAHRGYSTAAPENTLPALVAAAEAGATCCEIDVVLTRDDHLVLMHDEILERTTNGKGRVADYELADLRRLDAGSWFDQRFTGTPAPTLVEALECARAHGLGLLVEIKERQRAALAVERLAALLESGGHVEDVLVISFDHPSLVAMRERLPALRTELITHARHVDPAGLARKAGAASVAIEWDMFHPDDARALHDAGIAVRVTLPRPQRLTYRRERGLDDAPRFINALRQDLIDMLAGDDTAFIGNFVDHALR
jgi:glycerophosphoryl diester phosphodiesterase